MFAAHLTTIEFLFALLVLGIFSGCSRTENDYVAPPPPDATVITPLVHPLTLYLEENGETEASERAEVRARVRGFIESINFEPGQPVEKDMVLYTIEDDEYTAIEASASAELAAANASISVAKSGVLTAEAEKTRSDRELARQKTLLPQQATSQAEYDVALAADDSAKANWAAAKSQVEAAEAAKLRADAKLNDAQRNVGYTKVKAPIAGRVTKTAVKLGNLVDNGDGLAAVVDDTKIFVNFNISDRQILGFLKSRSDDSTGDSEQRRQWAEIDVEVQRELDDGFPFKGKLDYIDQEGVEGDTGTLQVRGIIANPDGNLFPGLFVRVRIPISTLENAILIPEQAVLRDRVGKYVLAVGSDRKVERRTVQTGQRIDGWISITNGIDANDSIVIEGMQRARPGIEVTPIEKPITEEFMPSFSESSTKSLPESSASGNDQETPEPTEPLESSGPVENK